MSHSVAPVILIIFNRPELTARTFAAIREARPNRLFIVADGPRPDRVGEAERCQATREVVSRVDWPCNVTRDVASSNMGLKRRISTGISNALSDVDRAIILEDDCVPDPSFFRYCSDLLERYKDVDSVMSISGTNRQQGIRRGRYSYYFSRYESCWGWATWRRAWRRMDLDLRDWPAIRRDAIHSLFPAPRVMRFWTRIFDRTYRGEIDSWAYPWAYAHFVHNGLAIAPNVNLVSNVGFGQEATHTAVGSSPYEGLATSPVRFPLSHPPYVVPDRAADQYYEQRAFAPSLGRRLVRRVRQRMLRLQRFGG